MGEFGFTLLQRFQQEIHSSFPVSLLQAASAPLPSNRLSPTQETDPGSYVTAERCSQESVLKGPDEHVKLTVLSTSQQDLAEAGGTRIQKESCFLETFCPEPFLF